MKSRWAEHALIRIVVAALALALASPAVPVAANGTPITIVLSYLKGVSNWGPANATGVAELIEKEGEVRLTATGLPQLDKERYQVWITNSATGEWLPLGQFNADAGGVAKLEQVLKEPIPDKPWDLLLVTVEAANSSPEKPSLRRAIAGRFPVAASGQAKPAELPRTGGPEPVDSAPSQPGPSAALLAGAGLVIWLVGGAAGFGLGRRVKGRSS